MDNNMVSKAGGFFKEIKNVLNQNGPTIATFFSIIGTAATIYFMHKASKNAAAVEEICDDNIEQIKNNKDEYESEEAYKSDLSHERMNKFLRLVWVYRYGLLCGAGAMAGAFLSNYLNGMQISGLTLLLASKQEEIKKYGKKIKETIGEEKFQKIQDDINRELALDTIKKDKVEKSNIKIANGDCPDDCEEYYDTFCDQFYQIDPRVLKDAISRASQMEDLDFNTWRNVIGLRYAKAFDGYSWTTNNPFKAHTSYIDLGDEGMKKTIVYDNEPDFTSFRR